MTSAIHQNHQRAGGNGVMLKILIGIGLGFLLFSNQGARQTTADILRFGADALAPEVDGPTLQEQINWDTFI